MKYGMNTPEHREVMKLEVARYEAGLRDEMAAYRPACLGGRGNALLINGIGFEEIESVDAVEEVVEFLLSEQDGIEIDPMSEDDKKEVWKVRWGLS